MQSSYILFLLDNVYTNLLHTVLYAVHFYVSFNISLLAITCKNKLRFLIRKQLRNFKILKF